MEVYMDSDVADLAAVLHDHSQKIVAFYYMHERAIRDACSTLPSRPPSQSLELYIRSMAANIVRKLQIDFFTAGLLAGMYHENNAA